MRVSAANVFSELFWDYFEVSGEGRISSNELDDFIVYKYC